MHEPGRRGQPERCDGASALLVLVGDATSGLRPLARIVTTAVAGVDPSLMGMGPVPATRKALARAGLTIDQIDLIELNEAFAAPSLVCMQELGLDPARVNVYGWVCGLADCRRRLGVPPL